MAMLIGCMLLAGCAKYDYQITQPEALATRITDVPTRIDAGELTYHMQSNANRLVIQIFNPSAQSVQLLGDRSFVVDPGGFSRPIGPATIAGNAYSQLMLPPPRPYYEHYGPRWGGYGHYAGGYGYGYGGAYYRSAMYGAYGPHYRPLYFPGIDPFDPEIVVYNDPNNAMHWEWSGETAIRLSFTYRREDDSTFRDEFTIQRVKR